MRCLLGLGLAAALAGCKFSPPTATSDGSTDVPEDAPVDAPPVTAEVRFVSVTADVAALRPGRYGFEVTAVLRNELDREITALRATLSFRDTLGDRSAHFRWRDLDARDGVMAPQPASIAAGGEATFKFRVDALAGAAPPGPILLDGVAVFQLDGADRSAAPLETPTSLPFENLAQPIVVNTSSDESNGNNDRSLREALTLANSTAGPDRIVFDPAVFPSTTQTTILLRPNLGPLPSVSEDLVIDGGGANVVLAFDSNWAGLGLYGLHLVNGTLVVHGLGFRDMGYAYPLEDLGGGNNNCGSNTRREGGAIRVDGGTLILDGNTFSDAGVAERNCYAASVRIHVGTGHRILHNRWTDPSMDALYLNTEAREITGNVFDAGSDLTKADECIFIESHGNADLWIVGNLCVDQEFSAIAVGGGGSGTLHAVHNTFVRNRDLGAVRRTDGNRAVVLRNNVYLDNAPTGIAPNNSGANFTIRREAEAGPGELCTACASAVQDMNDVNADLRFANPTGATLTSFTPQAGSELIDSGLDLVDRNGRAPGPFNGAGPERGAVELP